MDQQIERLRRKQKTSEQIADISRNFSESGSTVKQFCADHQIVPGTFHKWQSRLKGNAVKKQVKSGFAPVLVSPSFPGLFAEVKGVRIFQPVSAAYLKELMA